MFSLKNTSDINPLCKRHLRLTGVNLHVNNKMDVMEVQCEDADCRYFLLDTET
jgi:molybdenum cofactor biosynthesis enzyme